MGTHPIFESDFDCLTEGRGVLSKGIALSTMGYLQRFELQNQVVHAEQVRFNLQQKRIQTLIHPRLLPRKNYIKPGSHLKGYYPDYENNLNTSSLPLFYSLDTQNPAYRNFLEPLENNEEDLNKKEILLKSNLNLKRKPRSFCWNVDYIKERPTNVKKLRRQYDLIFESPLPKVPQLPIVKYNTRRAEPTMAFIKRFENSYNYDKTNFYKNSRKRQIR